jgi:hypothetical protein
VAVFPPPETVSVYAIVAAGVTATGVPLVTAPTPWSMLPVPPWNTAVSSALPPGATGLRLEVKLSTAGVPTPLPQAARRRSANMRICGL